MEPFETAAADLQTTKLRPIRPGRNLLRTRNLGLATPHEPYRALSTYANVPAPLKAFSGFQPSGTNSSPPANNIDFPTPNAKRGAFTTPSSHMDQDALSPPDRGRPRSRRRAVTDPFKATDSSLDHHILKGFKRRVQRYPKSKQNLQRDLETFDNASQEKDSYDGDSLPTTFRPQGKLSANLGRQHQINQPPQPHGSFVVDTYDRDGLVSRGSPVMTPLRPRPEPSPSPPQEMPQTAALPTSGDADLIQYLGNAVDLKFSRTDARGTLPGDEDRAHHKAPTNASSYWTVSESNALPHLLRSFGSDWTGIAAYMGSKTAVMVKNFFVRKLNQGSAEWDIIVKEADRKRAAGEKVPDPPQLSTSRGGRLSVHPQELPRAVPNKTSTRPLARSHYTISQDHTAGEDDRKSSLLANFPKRGLGEFRGEIGRIS